MIADIDLDSSGTIDFEEFVEMMTGKMGDRDSPEEIRRVFKLFDDDETGKISFRPVSRRSPHPLPWKFRAKRLPRRLMRGQAIA